MKKLEISKKDLKANILAIKKEVESSGRDDKGNKLKIIAVVKANAMGLDLIQMSKFLIENGITTLAVATVEEVVSLRNAKIDTEIIMLTPTSIEQEIKILLDNKATLTVGSIEELEKLEDILKKRKETANVHLKIDTGLGRYGFLYDNDEIIDCFEKAHNVKIVGMFTHFSKPIDEKWTRIQFNHFLDVVAGVRSFGYDPGILHVSASTAFLKYPDMRLNAVRIGSAFQGRTLIKKLNLKAIGTFKTNVSEIKIVPKGYNISYSNSYKTKKQTQIAILPVGYMDGLCRRKLRDSFSLKDNIVATLMEFKKIFKDNSIKVIINGKQYKIIGRIGMYHSVVDISDADIKVGDEVIIDISPMNVSNDIKREYN